MRCQVPANGVPGGYVYAPLPPVASQAVYTTSYITTPAVSINGVTVIGGASAGSVVVSGGAVSLPSRTITTTRYY